MKNKNRNFYLLLGAGLLIFVLFPIGLTIYLQTGDHIYESSTISLPIIILFTFTLVTALLTVAALISQKAQKETEQALQEETRRTQTIIDNLPGVIFQCTNDNPGFTYTYISEGCLAMTGYTQEELIGNPDLKFYDIVHPDDLEQLKKLDSHANATGQPTFEASFRIKTKDGSIKWIWERSRMVETNPDGTTHLIEGFYTDITELRRLEENVTEMANAKELAELSNRAKSDFLAKMSH